MGKTELQVNVSAFLIRLIAICNSTPHRSDPLLVSFSFIAYFLLLVTAVGSFGGDRRREREGGGGMGEGVGGSAFVLASSSDARHEVSGGEQRR